MFFFLCIPEVVSCVLLTLTYFCHLSGWSVCSVYNSTATNSWSWAGNKNECCRSSPSPLINNKPISSLQIGRSKFLSFLNSWKPYKFGRLSTANFLISSNPVPCDDYISGKLSSACSLYLKKEQVLSIQLNTAIWNSQRNKKQFKIVENWNNR